MPIDQPSAAADSPPASAEVPPPRARRRTTGSAMLLATLAILGLVIIWVLLIPRPTSVPRPAVDLVPPARGASSELGFTVENVVPPGWTVTSADVRRDTGGLSTWTVNYLTDTGRYVGLMQASGWNQRWQSSLTQGGTPSGELSTAGHTWQVLVKPEKEITSLLLREPKRTTLILAKVGGTEDAKVLADRLKLGS
ncbi:MAG: DUF4245 domain-containing protein [Kineosporiaceae bacterium]